jgi:hypothetical protein
MSEQKVGYHCPFSTLLNVYLYSCLTYAAGKAHAPCHIVSCGRSASTMFFFSHYLIKGMILGKKSY